ncbi:MAG TPA: sulfatase-like hydrolase/transferase [Bacteroidia bacterium]|nr:sulfatase-like hydrolase/transferase [Bacteroidia bacterium]
MENGILGEDNEHLPGRQGFATFFDARWKKNNAAFNTPDDPKSIYTVTRAGCNYMKEKKDSSFFLFLSYHAPHFPLEARPSSLQKFRDKTAGNHHNDALYAACVYDLDDGIGQVLRCLDSLGLSENTLVIFTSDNGSTNVSSSWPLRASKGTYYEGGIRAPLIIKWPGRIAVNSQCVLPVINVDFYPTFLAAAGVEKRKDQILDGENLLPVLSGGSKTLERACIFWHFPGYLDRPTPEGRDQLFRARPLTAVRKGDWKLILYHEEWLLDGGKKNVGTNNSVELYDLKDDEGETKNLANENISMRDELIQAIEDWWKATGAVLPSAKQ